MRWEIYTMLMPWLFSSLISSNRVRTSRSERLEVGSSRMIIRPSCERHLAISTPCFSAVVSLPTSVLTGRSRPTFLSISSAFLFIVSQSMTPRFVGSKPMEMFSDMLMFGIRLNSWNTMLMPSSRAAFGSSITVFLSSPAPSAR